MELLLVMFMCIVVVVIVWVDEAKNEFSNNSIRIMYSCYSDDADLGVGGTRR